MTRTLLLRTLASAVLATSFCLSAIAGPGAHGPNGEHPTPPPLRRRRATAGRASKPRPSSSSWLRRWAAASFRC